MAIHKSTIQLLRLPFSIVLLPVFLYAFYNVRANIDFQDALIVFLLIHFVFYPASNAYNSYMDDDEGSIGGLANPLKPTRQLFIVSNLLDIVGLILSWLISPIFTLINLFLVTLSRLYSWRSIRIKKYAIGSFFMVAFAQGALSYINIKHGIMVKNLDINIFSGSTLMEAGVAALFVGAIYPITQIYQHTEDKRNGVKTISMLVGKIGTLILSGTLFLISIYLIFSAMERSNFLLFGTFMIFPVSYFLYWFVLVTKNREKADYQHTMKMVITASFAMIFALTILILKFFLPH